MFSRRREFPSATTDESISLSYVVYSTEIRNMYPVYRIVDVQLNSSVNCDFSCMVVLQLCRMKVSIYTCENVCKTILDDDYLVSERRWEPSTAAAWHTSSYNEYSRRLLTNTLHWADNSLLCNKNGSCGQCVRHSEAVNNSSTRSTPWVKKTRHQTLAHNFTNYYPIFELLSLLDSVGNL